MNETLIPLYNNSQVTKAYFDDDEPHEIMKIHKNDQTTKTEK
jgi:hypothetical protein